MARKKDLTNMQEPGLNATLEILKGPWKILVIWCLKNGPKRFGDLMQDISGITQKMLTQALKDLASAHVLVRKSYPEKPPRVEYSLTDLGKTLLPVIEPMHIWGCVQLGLSKPKALERLQQISDLDLNNDNLSKQKKKKLPQKDQLFEEAKPEVPQQLNLFG